MGLRSTRVTLPPLLKGHNGGVTSRSVELQIWLGIGQEKVVTRCCKGSFLFLDFEREILTCHIYCIMFSITSRWTRVVMQASLWHRDTYMIIQFDVQYISTYIVYLSQIIQTYTFQGLYHFKAYIISRPISFQGLNHIKDYLRVHYNCKLHTEIPKCIVANSLSQISHNPNNYLQQCRSVSPAVSAACLDASLPSHRRYLFPWCTASGLWTVPYLWRRGPWKT